MTQYNEGRGHSVALLCAAAAPRVAVDVRLEPHGPRCRHSGSPPHRWPAYLERGGAVAVAAYEPGSELF